MRTWHVGLKAVSLDDIRHARFDEACEDLFFFFERLIARACGDDVAGRLHTARSRNDIDMTMYRMRLREMLLDLLAARWLVCRMMNPGWLGRSGD